MRLVLAIPAAVLGLSLLVSPLRAEVPPHIEWTLPAEGAGGVPLNTQIWLYGQTLADSHASSVQLVAADTGTPVAVSAQRLQAVDYHLVNRDVDRSGGWAGPSGNRYLIVIQPRTALAPTTRYTLSYNVEGPESVTFTTGTAADTTTPTFDGPAAVVHVEGGMDDSGPRRYTVVELEPVADDSSLPVRVDIYSGPAPESTTLVGFVLDATGPVPEAVLRGHEPRCVFARAVDLAGNATDLSACVQAR